ncbi:hypothetical protein HC022_10755 [Salipiger sp. HF18]|nr:hypothetical protein [Salipiger sp. HF18]
MSGMALNGELVPLGARFLRSCLTAPSYKLYALAGGPPPRPGLSRQAQGGRAIAGELWALPLPAAGRFLAGIPRRWASAPLRCRVAPRRSGHLRAQRRRMRHRCFRARRLARLPRTACHPEAHDRERRLEVTPTPRPGVPRAPRAGLGRSQNSRS